MLTPGDELIAHLEVLRRYLNQLQERLNNSGVERTSRICEVKGSSCQYYKKSLSLFADNDYDDLRRLVLQCKEKFDIIDGKVPHG